MTVFPLTALERAALNEICRRQGAADKAALEHQLASAMVTGRENTGAGFFTDLSIDKAAIPAVNTDRVLGTISVTIEGLSQPLLMMLFMKGGYAEFLEGAAVIDSTDAIDFSTIAFRIDPD